MITAFYVAFFYRILALNETQLLLSFRAKADRRRREGESRNLEKLCSTMLYQGIFTKVLILISNAEELMLGCREPILALYLGITRHDCIACLLKQRISLWTTLKAFELLACLMVVGLRENILRRVVAFVFNKAIFL